MSMKTKNGSAILILTNRCQRSILKFLDSFKGCGIENSDIFILFHQSNNKSENLSLFDGQPVQFFNDSILTEMGFRALGDSLLPGNNHFPVLKFSQEFSYDYYWCIEDDVRFNGLWSAFFSHFSHSADSSDFISSYIRDYDEHPYWHWWNYFGKEDVTLSTSLLVRSFNPIYRISKKAIDYLYEQLLSGWYGHHEVLMPTLLKLGDFIISDFGGSGKYVADRNKNKLYSTGSEYPHGFIYEGSMRYRPVINRAEMTKAFLYHPVKLEFS